MFPEGPERAGGLHPVYGRHHQNRAADAGLSRAQRIHHKSAILLAGLDAVMHAYDRRLTEARMARLHDRVLAKLRRALRDEWSPDDAAAYALRIAAKIESDH